MTLCYAVTMMMPENLSEESCLYAGTFFLF